MHSVTLGIVAAIERSALTWHVRHSIWLSTTCVLCGYAIGCGTRRAGQNAAAVAVATSKVSTRAPKTYVRMQSVFAKGKRESLYRFGLGSLGSGNAGQVVFRRRRCMCVRHLSGVALDPLQLGVHLRQLVPRLHPLMPFVGRDVQL